MNIGNVPESVGKEIEIRGWVYRMRETKERVFLIIRDSGGIVQVVFNRDHPQFEEAKKLTIESSLIVKGVVKEDKRSPSGYEIIPKKLKIVHIAERFPITRDQSREFLLDVRHLWIRSRRLTAAMKVRSTVLKAFREFYREQGYYELSPPILTPVACEGKLTLFEVKYYDKKMYLTQSWQLYAEAAIFGLEKIFTISPCFRAEKSKTSRHLSEFWMAEMEAAWMEFDELQKSAEECVSHIVQKVLEKNSEDLKLLGREPKALEAMKPPFPRLTYTEALELLERKHGLKIPWGKDLRTIEEDKISSHFDKPVIITNYPKEIMAFYKPKDPRYPKTAKCMDMIAPEGYGEIIGGSERDTDINELITWLKKQGEKPEHYEWYLDMRRYGSVPHSGYGLGIERVVAWLCKLDNIKDAIAFPRTMFRFKP